MICRILKEQDELAVFLVDAYQKLDIVCSVDQVIEFTVQCPATAFTVPQYQMTNRVMLSGGCVRTGRL